jgi:multidrug efflux pump subunit AcrA (membrane-fusion protein)
VSTTDIAELNSAELEAQDAIAAEVLAAQAQEYDDDEYLNTPILKIGQPLTREVQEGDAEAGEFINTLSNEGVGTAVEFIAVYYNRGRFATNQDKDKTFVAFDSTIPERWEELVGPEWVGEPFSEYPEAEEQYKAAVNRKEREWGKGPQVSTTHNYTGFVVADDDYQPVRLSLKRIDVPAHRKIRTLQRAMLRNKPPWDRVLRLVTKKETYGKNQAYTIDPSNLKFIRETSPEEKAMGSQLAFAVMQGRTVSAGAEDALDDKAAEPDAKGGLAV